MARYTGKATLEDWLSIEVFKCPIPKDVVHRFERYRTRVESDVQAWIDQCDTQRQGWNLWGRGRDNLDDSFYGLVQVCTPYVEAYAEFHGLARHDCTMSLYIVLGEPGVVSETMLVMADTLEQALDYSCHMTGNDRTSAKGYLMCDVNGGAQHPYGNVSKALREYVQIHNAGLL